MSILELKALLQKLEEKVESMRERPNMSFSVALIEEEIVQVMGMIREEFKKEKENGKKK